MITPRIGHWNRQLRDTGRLELYPARWPWALMAIAALLGVLAGLGMYGDAEPNSGQRIAGIIAMIFCGVIGFPMSIRTFLRGKQPIVIDDVGIRLPSRPLIPWYEVRGAGIYQNRSTRMVMIEVSEGFLSRFHADTNPMIRTVSMIDKTVLRRPAIFLPTTLKVDKAAFAEWLAAMAGIRDER